MVLKLKLKDRELTKEFSSLTYGQLIKFVEILDVKQMMKQVASGQQAAYYFLGKWLSYYEEIEKLLLEIFDGVELSDLHDTTPEAIIEVVTAIFSETFANMIGVTEKEQDLIKLILGEKINE